MTKSRTQYAVLNIASSYIGYSLNTVVGILCRMVFVRYLTEEHLGVGGLFKNIIMMLSLSELGLGAVLKYKLYEPIAKKDSARVASLLQYSAKIYRYIFAAIMIAGMAMLPYLNVLFKEKPAIDENLNIIYLLFVLNSAVSYLFAHQLLFLRASQKEYIISTMGYVATIFQSGLQILFLILTRNYLHYLLIQLLCTICLYLCISFIVRKRHSYLEAIHDNASLEKHEKRQIFKNVWILSLSRISGFLVNGTDNIIISKLIGIASVGLLSNYVLLIGVLQALFNSFINSIGASIGNFNVLSDSRSTSKLFHSVHFLVLILFGVFSIAFYFAANEVVNLLFGEQYVMERAVSTLLMLNTFMFGVIMVVGTFMNAIGIFVRGRLVVILTAVVNVALSIWFGQIWGVPGVLAATAIARLITNWWYQPFVLFKYGFEALGHNYKKFFLTHIYFIVAVTLSIYCSKLILANINVSGQLFALLNIMLASAIFSILILLAYRNSNEFAYCCEKCKQIGTHLRHR